MTNSADRRSFCRGLIAAAVLAAGGFALPAPGQTVRPAVQPASEAPMAFEVVSIREDASPKPGEDIAVTRDGWHMAHGSLMAPLLTAYVPTTPDAMMYTTATLARMSRCIRW